MADPTSDLAKYTLLVVGALFPIVNPIGNTPIFLSLTRGLSGHGRKVLARMDRPQRPDSGFLTSIFIGTHILAFFGISLPVVQVGGGLVVISTGWALLRRPDEDAPDAKTGPRKNAPAGGLLAPGVLPVTAAAVSGAGHDLGGDCGGSQPARGLGMEMAISTGKDVLLGSLLIAASIAAVQRRPILPQGIGRTLGDSAMNVVIRLSSFILVCIGVQILWNGLSTLLRTVIR